MKYDPISDLAASYVHVFEPNTDYYAIGDVHGCGDEYHMLCMDLHRKSRLNGRNCKIIQLGDMIDRGPAFRSVILNDPADFKIMGNHELNFLNEHYGNMQCRSNARQVNHDRLANLSKEDSDSIISAIKRRVDLLIMHDTEDGVTHVFTHAPIAGIESGFDLVKYLSNKSGSSFCMRSIPVDLNKLQSIADIELRMYHGHQSWEYEDINDQIIDQEHLNVKCFNLDSSCVYGGSLTAVRMNDGAVFSINAKKEYFTNQRK